MEKYYSIMVEFDHNSKNVDYFCEKLTFDILQTYMCDLFRMYPDKVKKKIDEHEDIIRLYEYPDEDDIVQLVFEESIEGNTIFVEHFIVYAENEDKALHILKDYLITKLYFV